MKLLAFAGLLFIGCSPTIQIVLPDAEESQTVYVVPPVIEFVIPNTQQDPVGNGAIRYYHSGDSLYISVKPDSIQAVVPVDKSKKQKVIEASLELLKALLSPNK